VIEDVEKILDDADGITSVHGRYYLLASHFYRLQGKHADYYRTALRFVVTQVYFVKVWNLIYVEKK